MKHIPSISSISSNPPIFLTLILLSLLLLFNSCDPNRVYEENKEIPEGSWNVKDSILFEVEIVDTISLHQIYINTRNTSIYQYSNLCLFISTIFPDRRIQKDSVECILADKSGKWLGSGWGDIWSNQILFKKGVKFPRKGVYKFAFEQAQRYREQAQIDNLRGIVDIGIRIERQRN